MCFALLLSRGYPRYLPATPVITVLLKMDVKPQLVNLRSTRICFFLLYKGSAISRMLMTSRYS